MHIEATKEAALFFVTLNKGLGLQVLHVLMLEVCLSSPVHAVFAGLHRAAALREGKGGTVRSASAQQWLQDDKHTLQPR